MSEPQLWGFQRPDGDIGIRNYIAVIAAMDNSNPTARRAAQAVRGAVPITPSFGRAMMGEDLELHVRTLAGLGTNPNVYGAVVISLESQSAHDVAERIAKTGRPVEAISLEEAGGTVNATQIATQAALRMSADASRLQRVPLPWSDFVLGLECGGSDGSSGMVSNPVTGLVSDIVVRRGSTTIMSEPLEILGGEHLLAARAQNPAVARRLVAAVDFCVNYAKERGIDLLGSNPTPDNIAGGLSTIEEKALGAIHKGGSMPLMEVVDHGIRPRSRGFCFMDAPAPGVENLTALAAAGTHAIIFSTGKGNTSGNPVAPVIKVCGNPYTTRSMRDNIDVDLSAVITGGMSLERAAEILDRELIEVCAGKMPKAEMLGEIEIAISRIGRNL